jgi:hypothetical protein
MQRVTFTNPANGSTYQFDINPEQDAETQSGTGFQQKQRQIERTSNTGNIGATRQQGDDGPFILHWQFAIYSSAQEQAMWQWYALSGKQSIYLTDFGGEQYEGQIITCSRMRQGALGGPRDTTSRGYYAIYVVEFEAWVFLEGLIATAGVNT